MNELGLLYNYLPTELAPPDELWGRLVKVLDNTERNTFERIEMLEIQPPISAWGNIVLALDKQDTPDTNIFFADTCLAMEVDPPISAWQNIEKLLDLETPVKKIGTPSATVRRILTGLAVAACLTGAIFLFVPKTNNQSSTNNTNQVATVNKVENKNLQPITTPTIIGNDSEPSQNAITKYKTESQANTLLPNFNDYALDSTKDLNLKKYKQIPVPNVITTNDKVASITGKIKDANGNIIDRIGDYITGGGYIAAIGPNGNTVNVSTKLVGMIEFFQEDSAKVQTEEYLDKVIRESNLWRQKFIDWKKKVDAADAKPSQLNFLDPIDLMHFLENNK